MKLYLDDMRQPPTGWILVLSIEAAKRMLRTGKVEEASLDHDLGACAECLSQTDFSLQGVMPHCTHVGTGYDLCLWMAETGHWPRHRRRLTR